jgi:hypothetical protein
MKRIHIWGCKISEYKDTDDKLITDVLYTCPKCGSDYLIDLADSIVPAKCGDLICQEDKTKLQFIPVLVDKKIEIYKGKFNEPVLDVDFKREDGQWWDRAAEWEGISTTRGRVFKMK